jgi:hypothetical protein
MLIAGHFENAVARLKRGEIILAKQYLRRHHLLALLTELTLTEIRKAAGAKADALAVRGFEALHEVLTAEEIFRVNVSLSEAVKPHLYRFAHRLVREEFGRRGPFLIHSMCMVRFFVPHDYWARHPVLHARQGFLTIQGPHHDSWFGLPTQGLNLWMAVGRVRPGNGLSIFPQMWARYLEHDGRRRLPRDHPPLGPAVHFTLDPGDLLLFHGEHLHASELNRTPETRYAITSRVVLEQPQFKDPLVSPWISSEEFD